YAVRGSQSALLPQVAQSHPGGKIPSGNLHPQYDILLRGDLRIDPLPQVYNNKVAGGRAYEHQPETRSKVPAHRSLAGHVRLCGTKPGSSSSAARPFQDTTAHAKSPAAWLGSAGAAERHGQPKEFQRRRGSYRQPQRQLSSPILLDRKRNGAWQV